MSTTKLLASASTSETTKLLAAASLIATDAEQRRLKYRILPFGQAGSTNLGKVIASKGTVTIPENVGDVTLNTEHDFTRPVGKAVSIVETDDGIDAEFEIAKTTGGNDLLEEAAAGLRTGASVEIEQPTIAAGGKLVSGLLTAVAAVVRPAYPAARLAAAETTPTPAAQPSVAMQAAAVPIGLSAPAASKSGPGLSEVTNMLANMNAVAAPPSQLKAALDQITTTDAFSKTNDRQWIDEVWAGRAFTPRFKPLVHHAPLTSMTITGWKFTEGKTPDVADYAGGGAQPTSNTGVATEAVTATAARVAGAHAIDRIHRDFPSVSFWNGYFRHEAENYDRFTDAKVEDFIISSAGAQIDGGTVPTDVAKAAAYIVDGAAKVLEFANPTFAMVNTALYRQLLLTRRNDVLEYLSMALGLEEGDLKGFRIQPSSDLGASQVLVGAAGAITYYELPGTPIRVDVDSLATGNIETGVFGYYATMLNDARGLALVGDAA